MLIFDIFEPWLLYYILLYKIKHYLVAIGNHYLTET